MRPIVRPSVPADGPGIAALLEEVFGFGPEARVVHPRHMHWKYWQERGDWPGPRSFVLARGDQILGHAGIVPGACLWGKERLTVLHVIDWAARPGVLGAGITLMRHVGRLADAQLAVGGSEQTLAILPSLGFRPHGAVTQFVRALRPLRGLAGATELGRRAVPRLVARSLLATVTAKTRVGTDWRVRVIAREDLAPGALPLPAPAGTMAVLERSSIGLGHALECPVARMTLHAVEQAGQVRGYFLVAFTPGKARLVDCWIDSGDPAEWRTLVELAVREARVEGDAGRLVASASDPLLCECLLDCGFVAGRVDPLQLLATGGRSLPNGPLRVQMLDNDFAWL